MLKSLKIAGDTVPVKYKKLPPEDAGEYDTYHNTITLRKGLPRDEHDETIVHEMVHALQSLSSLRHLGISEDAWEMICGEVGRAVAQNFKLIPKK
jgi:hypothetical protein